MKTIAIRLDDELHARLSAVAQLLDSTLSDEIRQAIEDRLEHMASNPDLTSKAQAVLDTIERDAATRKAAISAMFGKSEASATEPPKRGRSNAKATNS